MCEQPLDNSVDMPRTLALFAQGSRQDALQLPCSIWGAALLPHWTLPGEFGYFCDTHFELS